MTAQPTASRFITFGADGGGSYDVRQLDGVPVVRFYRNLRPSHWRPVSDFLRHWGTPSMRSAMAILLALPAEADARYSAYRITRSGAEGYRPCPPVLPSSAWQAIAKEQAK